MLLCPHCQQTQPENHTDSEHCFFCARVLQVPQHLSPKVSSVPARPFSVTPQQFTSGPISLEISQTQWQLKQHTHIYRLIFIFWLFYLLIGLVFAFSPTHVDLFCQRETESRALTKNQLYVHPNQAGANLHPDVLQRFSIIWLGQNPHPSKNNCQIRAVYLHPLLLGRATTTPVPLKEISTLALFKSAKGVYAVHLGNHVIPIHTESDAEALMTEILQFLSSGQRRVLEYTYFNWLYFLLFLLPLYAMGFLLLYVLYLKLTGKPFNTTSLLASRETGQMVWLHYNGLGKVKKEVYSLENLKNIRIANNDILDSYFFFSFSDQRMCRFGRFQVADNPRSAQDTDPEEIILLLQNWGSSGD